MERTIVVQLNPTPEQARLLQRTLHEHTACFNTVARLGFASKCSNGVELHKETYYPLRAAFPDLPAQLVCAARVKATEAVKSALTWAKKHEAAYPRHAGQYIGSKVCSTDLCFRKGRYFLHIVVSIAAPPVSPSQEVIGVDLGLNRPAVTSTRQFLGERRWKEQERRIFRLRRKLQKNGSKSATALFLCRSYGYCLNADLNASINIKRKYLASLGTSLAGGSPVKRPIVSDLRV